MLKLIRLMTLPTIFGLTQLHATPVIAQATVNDQIVAQLREECRKKGGIFENSRCTMPTKPAEKSSSASSCGFLCKLAVGTVVIGGIAYCKANPDKC